MNDQEKRFALIVGGSLVVILGFFGASFALKHFKGLNKKVANLKQEVSGKRRELRFARNEVARMERFRERALSRNDREQSEAIYKPWLYEIVNKAGLRSPNVKIDAGRRLAPNNYVHVFTITGSGNLQQITGLLHDFYSADMLHRVKQLQLKPRGAKMLDLSMGVEVLALPDVELPDAFTAPLSMRLAGRSRESVEKSILDRNLFGPKNNPPELQLAKSYDATVGEEFVLNVRTSDKDAADKARIDGEVDDLPGARFSGGRLSWRPKEAGEFTASFVAWDDGVPSKSDRREIKIVAKDPPPPKAPTPVVTEKKPEFDHSRFTFVTAIINGRDGPRAHLNVRTQNKQVVLHEGDEFQIGTFNGEVRSIDTSELAIEFLDGGKTKVVRLEQALSQAVEMSPAVETAAGG